jgi:hypothetical protein
MLDSAVCFGNNCTKRLQGFAPSAPLSVAIQFTDNTGMPHMAFTRASYENVINVTYPNWRNDPYMINYISKSIMMAEVAKAYYIDKTITKEDIEI